MAKENSNVAKLTELIKANDHRLSAFNAAMIASYARTPKDNLEDFYLDEDDTDYLKINASNRYFEIEDKTDDDIQLWLDWQLGKCNQPVEDKHGKYIHVAFDSISFTIDKRSYTIHDSHVYGSDNDTPVEHLPILSRIVSELNEIKRLIE